MNNIPETAQCADFSQTIAEKFYDFVQLAVIKGQNPVEEVIDELHYCGCHNLVGIAQMGQFLNFLKDRLKPKQYEEALASTLGWASGLATRILKLAPVLGEFTLKQLEEIESNLDLQVLYKLAAGRVQIEVIRETLLKACSARVSKKDIPKQPRKKPTPWRYVGNGREYQLPRISERFGMFVEQLLQETFIPRRLLIEQAIEAIMDDRQKAQLEVMEYIESQFQENQSYAF
ncbi:hypothetical protein [Scytonema sp. NUACC26]|uniref:hypothetical protein n=1 Tax=Scytonema sp. NUACC26 TaxID=3140176 RepID=UPI0034DC74D5